MGAKRMSESGWVQAGPIHAGLDYSHPWWIHAFVVDAEAKPTKRLFIGPKAYDRAWRWVDDSLDRLTGAS
jgi:hypothetical protein